jgi:hypothetical protein
MEGPLKLEARAWDMDWHCYDVDRDPYETHDLGSNACGHLRDLSLSTYGRLPGGSRDETERDDTGKKKR